MVGVLYVGFAQDWAVGGGGGGVDACPDGLGHFFVHTQIGNSLFRRGFRSLVRMVCPVFLAHFGNVFHF